MKKLFVLALVHLLAGLPVKGGEGMWLPYLLQTRSSELKKSGLRLTAREVYDANRSSLKDAIVHFGGFCTGEVVSNQGLILTNHHCGYDAIQSHSSLEDDYLTHGFWAKNKGEEKPNPGLFVDFIRSMEDVSTSILKDVTPQMSEAERNLHRRDIADLYVQTARRFGLVGDPDHRGRHQINHQVINELP